MEMGLRSMYRREAARARAAALIVLVMLTLSACAAPPAEPTVTPTVTLTPTITLTPTRTATSTATIAPTWTATSTPTLTPTVTQTLVPAAAGTALPPLKTPIIELSLNQVSLLAEWGRGKVDGLAWSPTGGLIAVTTPLGVYLYDSTAFGAPLHLRTNGLASNPVFSPDGRFLAVNVFPNGSGFDLAVPLHRLLVWDLEPAQPELVANFDTGGQLLAAAFLDNALHALTRTADGGQYQRWDLASGTRVMAMNLSGGEAGVVAAFAPDLSLAATRGENGPVRIWRLSDGLNMATTREPVGAAGPLAFSPDGKLLAAGYPDGREDFFNSNRVRAWRMPEGPGELSDLAFEVSAPSAGEGTQETLLSLAWSPDGNYLAAGFEDYRVAVWFVRNGMSGPVFRDVKGTSLPAYLAWAPSLDEYGNPRLAAGGLEVWSIGLAGDTTRQLASVDDFLPGIFDMQFSPDGSNLALAGFGMIDFRAVSSGARRMVISGMNGKVNGIAYDPDGDLFAAACQDGTTRIYQADNGRFINILGEPTYPIRAVDFSPDGRWVASSSENMRVQIYRVSDGVLMYGLVEPFVAYELRFSPNTDQIASLTTSGVRLRGMFATDEDIFIDWESWIGGVGLTDLEYSPGEEFLVLVGNDVVRVVDPLTGSDVYTLYEPSGALPWAVAISPDNAFLAVGWSDGQVRVYWAQDGRPMRTWQAHPAAIRRLAFTRDGRLLATLGEEGTIRIWGVAE